MPKKTVRVIDPEDDLWKEIDKLTLADKLKLIRAGKPKTGTTSS